MNSIATKKVPASSGPITRLFHADSSSDVVCASLVANQLPSGNDILCVSTGKAHSNPQEYLDALRGLTGLHDWQTVVDMSGLSIQRRAMSTILCSSVVERWYRLQDTRRDLQNVRRLIAPLCGLERDSSSLSNRLNQKIDELYITCLHHPDNQALYRIFPRARKIYFPHTLDSLVGVEIDYYAPYLKCGQVSLSDRIKRLIWGADAVPLRQLNIDAAYSFNLPLPTAKEQHQIRHLLSRFTMSQLFARLPIDVQNYYRDLARCCNEDAALLLLTAGNYGVDKSEEMELYVSSVDYLIKHTSAKEILVKPHPLSSPDWVEEVLVYLRSRANGADILMVREHFFYPIEIILAPFHIKSCAGIGSTSLRSLHKIHGLQSYCPENRMLHMLRNNAPMQTVFKQWAADFSHDYIAI